LKTEFIKYNTKKRKLIFLVQVFGTKTFNNFESLAFNTARSAGTTALCEAKAALR